MESQPEPAASQRKDRPALWALLGVLVGFGLPALFCLATFLGASLSLAALGRNLSSSTVPGQEQQTSGPPSGPAIAELDLSGAITGGTAGLLPTSSLTASEDLIGQIQAASQNPDVKALVLRVDSPGGDVVASDEIYHALKVSHEPLVVLIGDEGASGAYYVSMAADYIIANPDSLTGSIGVISEVPDAQQLLDKLGVQVTVIKSGAEKDMGSPFRPMSDADKVIMQGIIDEAYNGFVTVVASGRHLPRDQVLQLADGRVFTGRQALQLGLVDALGYEGDAIAKAAQLGRISGTPRVIHYGPGLSLVSFFSSLANVLSPQAVALNLLGQPSLQYRWTP